MTQELKNKDFILAYLKELKPMLEKDGIVELGLFGSYAKGVAKENSDIDVFIKTTRKFCDKYGGFGGFSFLENLRQKISKKFNKEVDLCDIAGFDNKQKN